MNECKECKELHERIGFLVATIAGYENIISDYRKIILAYQKLVGQKDADKSKV